MKGRLLMLFLLWTATPQASRCQESWLDRYNLAEKNPLQFPLRGQLSEASGLTLSSDGKLFSHNDEHGVVYQLDYSTGAIVKRFRVGSIFMQEDFEGIAMKGDTMFLVTSDGKIIEFCEGEDGARVNFILHRTPLGRRNDVEGLEYDPETDCLLLPCKGNPEIKGRKSGRDLSPYKAVYSFSLRERKLLGEPRFLIPRAMVHVAHRGQFHPSGIARHPVSGTFFIISATGECIIEVSGDGRILAQTEIPRKVNKQPEGIAFGPDLSIILCNDGQRGAGSLTVYPILRTGK